MAIRADTNWEFDLIGNSTPGLWLFKRSKHGESMAALTIFPRQGRGPRPHCGSLC